MNKVINKQNPYIIEERLNNITQLDIFSRLMADRIIYISGEINDNLADIVVGQIMFLNHIDNTKPITLYINSGGGSVTSGNAILDIMDWSKAPIYTTAISFCASMAAVILSNGEKGYRKSLKRSRIMIHQPSSGFTGTSSDITIAVEELRVLEHDIYKTLSNNTGKDIDVIKQDCISDKFMSAEDAIKYGLIDEII